MAAVSNFSLPSLANAAGSRVDSAAKHNLACKVDSELIRLWVSQDTRHNTDVEMDQRKFEFAMQKDELVMNVTSRMFADSVLKHHVAAYPAVTTTLANIPQEIRVYLCALYASEVPMMFQVLKEKIKENLQQAMNLYALEIWRNMPDFRAQGYALGTAYANALSGDTVGTVMIGGIFTAVNGAFPMSSGQLVQWYFDFEECFFHADSTGKTIAGARKDYDDASLITLRDAVLNGNVSTNTSLPKHPAKSAIEKQRNDYTDRMFGMENNRKRGNVFRIKAYIEADFIPHYGDRSRIFAKCITGGRPHDRVDIMLMTQSM